MKKFLSLSFLLLGFPCWIFADIKLPNFFSDHMVLQRSIQVPVWGWSDPGAKVEVDFAGEHLAVTADDNGKWMVKLNPMPASAEPRELTVSSGSSSLKIRDVLVGDVWLAGGQSNMGFPLGSADNAGTVLPKATDSQLRFFIVTKKHGSSTA